MNLPMNASKSEYHEKVDDPFLEELLHGVQICFASCPHARLAERQRTMVNSAIASKSLSVVVEHK